MDTLEEKIEAQQKQLDAIYKSVEKTRKYFVTMLWITVIAFVLPIIGLIIAVPIFLNSYIGLLGSF